MDSNSRQFFVIGGGYVEQGPTAPKYRAILPKQPVVPRILEQQPLTTANFKLLTYNLQPTQPADLEADISVDPHLKDTNMVQIKTQSTGTSKVISLLKSLWFSDSMHYNHKDMVIFTSDIKHPIYCHASILSMVSTYTQNLIESSGPSDHYGYSLCLPDVSYNTMKHFLERLYGLDETECEKGYDVSEMNYMVAALGIKFDQSELPPKGVETECKSEVESDYEFHQKNELGSNEDNDGFDDFHFESYSDNYQHHMGQDKTDSLDSEDAGLGNVSVNKNTGQAEEAEIKNFSVNKNTGQAEEAGIKNFSVNENTGQAKCITCGDLFTTLDPRLGVGRMSNLMKSHAEKCSPNTLTLTTHNEPDHNYSSLDNESKTKIPEQMTVQCDKCPQILQRKRTDFKQKGDNVGYRSIEATLRAHYKLHHDENLPLKCDLCDYRALTVHAIKVHKGKCHNSNKHPCRLGCGKVFTLSASRGTHEKRWCSKSTVKEKLIQDEIADGRYAKELEKVKQRGNKFKDRMDRLRTDPKSLLNCELCGVSTGSPEELVIHMKDTHQTRSDESKHSNKKNKAYRNKEYIQCDKCPYFGKNIDQHLDLHHNPDLPHGCQKCGYRALNERSISVHTSKVHKEKKIQCKLGCGRMFDNQWYASYHEKRFCSNSKVKAELIKKEIESGKYELLKKRQYKVRSKRVSQMNLLKDPKEVTACHFCGQFVSKRCLNMHISKLHANESTQ